MKKIRFLVTCLIFCILLTGCQTSTTSDTNTSSSSTTDTNSSASVDTNSSATKN